MIHRGYDPSFGAGGGGGTVPAITASPASPWQSQAYCSEAIQAQNGPEIYDVWTGITWFWQADPNGSSFGPSQPLDQSNRLDHAFARNGRRSDPGYRPSLAPFDTPAHLADTSYDTVTEISNQFA